jgi:hypothetical protein
MKFLTLAPTRHPERSRGIPLRKLKGNFFGIPRLSLGMTAEAALSFLTL